MTLFLFAVAALLVYDVFMVGKHLMGSKAIARLAPLHPPVLVVVVVAYALLVRQDAEIRLIAMLGILPAACGLALGIAAVVSLRAQTITPGRLVRDGIYAHVRNPLYSGVLLISIGLILLAPSWRVAVFFVLLVISFWAIIKAEELELAKRCGQPYEEYRREVPALVPRLFPRR